MGRRRGWLDGAVKSHDLRDSRSIMYYDCEWLIAAYV